jgi:fructose-bisphosphate aldolase class I
MRSIVKTMPLIGAVLDQQFQLAQVIYAAGLMPIVEPEVPIDSEDKIMLEEFLARELHTRLEKFDGKCILKLTLPERPNLYHQLTQNPKVHKVVGLSGGYDTREACNKLGLQDDMTASFSRALSEGLFYQMSDSQFNEQLSANISEITKASA